VRLVGTRAFAAQTPSNGDWEELVARFQEAPLELAIQRELRCRADSKFILPPSAAAELIRALTGDYVALAAGAGLVASYRTLYFDTPELDFFHAHRRSRRVRHKVRVRHYPDRRITLLEVKTRKSELQTIKEWRIREYGDHELSADDQAFVAAHTGIDRGVRPQVWTDFRRLTLLGAHTNERITVDVDVAFTMGMRSRRLDDVAVVEVKQWPFSRNTPVMASLRGAGWRPCGISKYCAAVTLMRPEVRHNRLLPDLRALDVSRRAPWAKR